MCLVRKENNFRIAEMSFNPFIQTNRKKTSFKPTCSMNSVGTNNLGIRMLANLINIIRNKRKHVLNKIKEQLSSFFTMLT